MITYTLTRPKMVEYLESKLNQLTTEITTLKAELDTAVPNYVVALDSLGNYLRYELYDPSATLITNVVTEAAYVRKRLHNLLTFTNDRLLTVDENYYYFSYSDYELRARTEFNSLHSLWDNVLATSTSAVSIQSSLKELQCKSLTLTQELQLASLSKEATFQLISKCKL